MSGAKRPPEGRPEGRKYVTRVFDDLDTLADFAAGAHYKHHNSDHKWSGGSLRECVLKTRDGDLGLAAQSEALLARFESLRFETPRREWRSDVSGFVPNVPAYIAGHPNAMRRRERAPSVVAPITVFVDVFASAAFSHQAILARGAAVLALVRVLARVRPISLYVGFGSTAWNGGSGMVAVRINTSPLDLAHAAWALCGIGFLRQVLFSALEGTFPSGPFPALRPALADVAAEMLPAGTQVIAVSGVVSNITQDPGAWISERIREALPAEIGAAG